MNSSFYNWHYKPPGVISPSTQIDPITGVQTVSSVSPADFGIVACRSNGSSATTELYLDPQFFVMSAEIKIVAVYPETVTLSSSRISPAGS